VATIQRLPQRTIESIFPTPGTVSPPVAFHTPFGPSKTTVPPLTSRIVHPSMVVGLVSGTAAGLVEPFVPSTAVGCGALVACFDSNEPVVWAPRFEVSCALLVAEAIVFADEPCTASRSDWAAWGGSAEELALSTGSDAGLVLKKSKLNPPIHPRKRASANDNTPVIIVMARRVPSRAGVTATRSRLSILISRSHSNATSGVVALTQAIGGAPEPLFKSAVALLFAEGAAGPLRPLEESSELALSSRVSFSMAAMVCRALITGFMSKTFPSESPSFRQGRLR